MNPRPLPVTLIAWLLIAAGLVGFFYHLSGFKTLHPFPSVLLLVEAIRILAVIAGAFMLRGCNWARWLAIFWIAFHVMISAFHSPGELAFHAVLLVVIAVFLFRPNANAFFDSKGAAR